MDKKYIDRFEAANRLGVSAPTLTKLAKDGLLTQYRMPLGGRRVLYDVEEVDNVRYQAPRPVVRSFQACAE